MAPNTWTTRLTGRLNNLSLATKIPVVIVAVALFAALATGYTAHSKFTSEMEAIAKDKLTALRESRQIALSFYLTSIKKDLEILANSQLIQDALFNFTAAWPGLVKNGDDDALMRELQRLYILENPRSADRKEALDDAGDGSDYSTHHRKYHPWIRDFAKEYGYDDIYLLASDGNLVYSVFKGNDFATNFIAGDWRDTDLGNAFRAANLNRTPGFPVFTDFKAYPPNQDAPASFMTTPVFNSSGGYIGVLGLQMPLGRINAIMTEATGLGETGESYFVGEDRLMRTDSRFSNQSTTLKTIINTTTAAKALEGQSGVERVDGYRGMPVISAYAPMIFLGSRWAILTEMEVAEIFAPITKTTKFVILTIIVSSLLVAMFGIYLARGMSKPIVQMTRSMRAVADGNLDVEVVGSERRDEIGDMAHALAVFRKSLIERERAEEEIRRQADIIAVTLENMDQGISMVDENLEVIAYNSKFRLLLDLPPDLVHRGTTMEQVFRYNAERGEYGDGDMDEQVQMRLDLARKFEPHQFERVRPDGRIIEVKGQPVASGGLVATYTDITERKRSEERLKQSEEQIRGMLDSCPVGVSVIAANGNRVFINSRHAEMFGRTKEEMIGGNSDTVFVDLAVRDRLLAIYQEAGELRDFEAELVHADGSTFWVLLSITPTEYGGEPARLVWIYDVTERYRAAAEIERQKSVIETVLGNMDQGVIMYDADLKVQIFNETARRLFGFSEDLLVEGAQFQDLVRNLVARGSYGERDVEHQVAKSAEVVRSTPVHATEVSIPDGGILEVRRRPAPGGGVVATQTDITARKEAERTLDDAMQLVTESIQYASRIQRSVLPEPGVLEDIFADHLVIWLPKDVVGGDIYLHRQCRGGNLLILIDCTGHGVPGAIMAMVATGAFDQALIEIPDGDPAALLARTNQLVKIVLGQEGADGESDDGFECGICRIDDAAREITFAGARFELWRLDDKDFTETKGDRTGIGYRRTEMTRDFTNHVLQDIQDSAFYMCSDGLVDQVGGAKRRAFGKRRVKNIIRDYSRMKMALQATHILRAFEEYQHNEERRDDVSLIGFRPNN